MPAACWKGCWRKTWWLSPGTEPLSSFLGGNGERRRSMEQSHLPTAAFRVGTRNPPGTILYTWKCISTSCNFHSICSATSAPQLSRWEPSLLPEPLPCHPPPSLSSPVSLALISLSRGLNVAAALPQRPPLILNSLRKEVLLKSGWTSFLSPPLSPLFFILKVASGSSFPIGLIVLPHYSVDWLGG